MSELSGTVRKVMEAYNNGDPEPLVATFREDVQYIIVDLGKTFRGLEEVTALARQGAGQTRFHLHDIICHGTLVSFTYDHDNPMAEIAYRGPGLAVQNYDDDGRLIAQWAYRE
ncbi:nuclear transport factor 2 family protein [Arthrobacter sp. D1-17]